MTLQYERKDSTDNNWLRSFVFFQSHRSIEHVLKGKKSIDLVFLFWGKEALSWSYFIFGWIWIHAKVANTFKLEFIQWFRIFDAIVSQSIRVDDQWILEEPLSNRSLAMWAILTGLISERKPPGTSLVSSGFGCKNLNQIHRSHFLMNSGFVSNLNLQSIVQTDFTIVWMRDPMNEAFRFRNTFISRLSTGHFQFDRFIVRILKEESSDPLIGHYIK